MQQPLVKATFFTFERKHIVFWSKESKNKFTWQFDNENVHDSISFQRKEAAIIDADLAQYSVIWQTHIW